MTPSTSSRERRGRVTSPGPGAAIPRPHRPLPHRGRTFQSSRSGTAFVGGICSPARAGGVNEVGAVRPLWGRAGDAGLGGGEGPCGDSPVPSTQYGNVAAMAVTLAQTLGQNLGMMWNKHRTAAGTCHPPGAGWGAGGTRRCHQASSGTAGTPSPSPLLPGDCRCPDSWLGCIMEDTGWVPTWGGTATIPHVPHVAAPGGGIAQGPAPFWVSSRAWRHRPSSAGGDGGPRPAGTTSRGSSPAAASMSTTSSCRMAVAAASSTNP